MLADPVPRRIAVGFVGNTRPAGRPSAPRYTASASPSATARPSAASDPASRTVRAFPWHRIRALGHPDSPAARDRAVGCRAVTPRKVGDRGPGAIGGLLAARLSQAAHDARRRRSPRTLGGGALWRSGPPIRFACRRAAGDHDGGRNWPTDDAHATLAFLRSVSRPSTEHVDPSRSISIVPDQPVRQRGTEGSRA
jgi:hypothetical protein